MKGGVSKRESAAVGKNQLAFFLQRNGLVEVENFGSLGAVSGSS